MDKPLAEGAGIRATNAEMDRERKEWEEKYREFQKAMTRPPDYPTTKDLADYIETRQGEYEVKDTGKRDEFDTGAVRDQRIGKGRYDLLAPEFLSRVAVVLEAGARKYGERNWEKGIPLSRTFDSLVRHLYQWLGACNDEDHLAHAACNLQFLIATESRAMRGQLPSALIDVGPNRREEKT